MRQLWTEFVRAVLLPAFAFILASCQNIYDENNHPVSQEVGFYAGGVQTRTEMLSNGLSARWTNDDMLALWARSSSGDYLLSGQVFKAYGLDSQVGYFTSELNQPMPEDTYTYYCSYPLPLSADLNKVTFNLPSVQDGKVSGGADIMLSTPVQHGPLTAMPEVEDHSGLKLQMQRQTHQFRFYIPAENTVIGNEKLERIMLTFPSSVAGKVTYDLQNPQAAPVVTDAVNSMELVLAEPLGISVSAPQYACVAVLPQKFADGDKLQVKAYTHDKVAYFDAIDLQTRDIQAGHSTPVMLVVKELSSFAGIITFTVSSNNLGEDPNSITFTAPSGCKFGDGQSNVYTYNPGRKIAVGEKIVFKFESDEASYMAFSGKQINVSYDSDHAIVKETVTMPTINKVGKTEASLNIPYLLFEDFSGLLADGESYGDNGYASDDRNQPGVSLNGVMPYDGWNAARFWVKKDGGAFRVNMRFQMVRLGIGSLGYSFTTSHYGRLDTPPLTALKDGVTAALDITFDAGANVHSSSNSDALNGDYTYISVSTHENASNPINGVGVGTGEDGDLKDFGFTCYTSSAMPNAYGAEDFSNRYPTHTVTNVDATNKTRLCFYPSTSFAKEGLGINAEFNVYIDNIKISIAK